MIFLAGPGLGAPGVLGPVYLEGTYSEVYPDKSQDTAGLGEFLRKEGNINTPMELAINNEIDRFSLAIDVIDRTPALQRIGAHAKERCRDLQTSCRNYTYEHGIDKPEIVAWKRPY